MLYRELSKYKYGLLVDEIFDVDLPDIHSDSFNESFPYISLKDKVLTVLYSYAWNGSSVPFKKRLRELSIVIRIFTIGIPIVPIYDADKWCKIASLFHDAVCQLIREGLLPMSVKEYVDKYYRNLCIIERMKKWEALKPRTYKQILSYKKKVVRWADRRYWALRKFGDKYVQEKYAKGKILEV